MDKTKSIAEKNISPCLCPSLFWFFLPPVFLFEAVYLFSILSILSLFPIFLSPLIHLIRIHKTFEQILSSLRTKSNPRKTKTPQKGKHIPQPRFRERNVLYMQARLIVFEAESGRVWFTWSDGIVDGKSRENVVVHRKRDTRRNRESES